MASRTRVISAMVLALLAFASLFIRRTNNVWVVGGHHGRKYCDNSMYFLKFCGRQMSRRVIWLSYTREVVNEVRADGEEAYLAMSPRGLWYALRAQWHISDTSLRDTGLGSRNALLLNLWHGIPLKDIRFLKRDHTRYNNVYRLIQTLLWGAHREARTYLLHPNHANVHHVLDAFDIPPANIIYGQLPRALSLQSGHDPKASSKASDLSSIDRLQSLRATGHRIIGYFPTWRGDGTDLFLGTSDRADLARLNEFLKQHDSRLVTKWHDSVYAAYKHSGANPQAEALMSTLSGLSNVIVLDFRCDTNSHLALCDLLVTDYSSVLFDYLLTDRSMLFMAYDLNTYKSKWGFYYDYEAFVPGPIAKSFEGLLMELNAWAMNRVNANVRFATARAKCRSLSFDCARPFAEVIARMDDIAKHRKKRTPD